MTIKVSKTDKNKCDTSNQIYNNYNILQIINYKNVNYNTFKINNNKMFIEIILVIIIVKIFFK